MLSKYSKRFKRKGKFYFYQNLDLGKASTDDEWHFDNPLG